MARPLLWVVLLGVIAGAAPPPSAAQWQASRPGPEALRRAAPPTASHAPRPAYAPHAAPTQRLAVPETSHSSAGPIVAPTLLSLAVPGAGQHVLGQNRKWLYAALEVAGWAVWVERRASARDYRGRYRDYAWERARIQAGARVDGDFEYYERMTQWMRSGAFDADPVSGGLQPEMDPGTYNGSIWSLASQIHLPPGPPPPDTDPAYQSALSYYQSRAYDTELLWDWTAGTGSRQELARLIEASDSRFGHATTALGAVIANHLFSAVDAYVSARGRGNPARLRMVPADALGPAPGWLLVLSLDARW